MVKIVTGILVATFVSIAALPAMADDHMMRHHHRHHHHHHHMR